MPASHSRCPLIQDLTLIYMPAGGSSRDINKSQCGSANTPEGSTLVSFGPAPISQNLKRRSVSQSTYRPTSARALISFNDHSVTIFNFGERSIIAWAPRRASGSEPSISIWSLHQGQQPKPHIMIVPERRRIAQGRLENINRPVVAAFIDYVDILGKREIV